MLYSITDTLGRRSIIIRKDTTPEQEWLDLQEVKPSTTGDWYTCYPLTGGAVVVNVDDMRVLRPATAEEVEEAFNNANGFAKDSMIRQLTR